MKTLQFGNEKSDIVLIQMVDEHELSMLEREIEIIKSLTDKDFCLIAVCVNDWNKDLSPWTAPPVYGNEDFGNGADDTLSWLLNNFVFGLKTEENDKRRYHFRWILFGGLICPLLRL